jgi:hypothetical protein
MNANHTLHAVFSQIFYTLDITTTIGGTTDPTPGNHTFVEGTAAWVTAIPDTGSILRFWELDGDNIGSINPISIAMYSNRTLRAVFAYTLTITTTSGGTANPTAGTYTYTYGTAVYVEANPDSGYVFDYWKLDGVDFGSTNPISVEMYTDHALQAVFIGQHDIGIQYLNLSRNLVGQGYNVTITVRVVNEGINDETFNVTVYANTTIIQTKTIALTRGSATDITFTWDTTSFTYSNYTITAVVDTIPGEVDTFDNTFTHDTVQVTIPGDVNGDRMVDSLDIGTLNAHWCPASGTPLWSLGYSLNVDTNDDGYINSLDIGVVNAHWGESW